MGYDYTDKASFECRLGKILVMRGHEPGVMTREHRGDTGLSGVAFKHLLTSGSHWSLMVTLFEYSHFTNESSKVWRWDIEKGSAVCPITVGKRSLSTFQERKASANGTGSHELVVGGLGWRAGSRQVHHQRLPEPHSSGGIDPRFRAKSLKCHSVMWIHTCRTYGTL